MRRSVAGLLGLSAGVAGLLGAAAPAGADPGGNLHTTSLSDSLLLDVVPPGAPLPPLPFTCAGGDLSGADGTTSFTGTGNAVAHVNGNNNGVWTTLTEEGQVTLVMTPGDTYTGHLAFWFGLEGNRQNFVVHMTLDFEGWDQTSGIPASIHADFQTATTPTGATTASHFTVRCS